VIEDHVAHNRAFWDRDADEYQAAHGEELRAAPLAWGAFRRPESELRILDDVAGRDVLELGCGAAQWSIALRTLGARCVGLDISQTQLAHARRAHGVVPLVLAGGEMLPFTAASFDVVFCDHGALSFCDPDAIVPEVARVLRVGGQLAFCITHPLIYLTWDDDKQRHTRRLQIPFSELGRTESEDGTIDWALPASAWIDVLRASAFEIERLVELIAADDATTTYDEFAPPKWARRWPAEWIWVARRRG
jgi:SAM-dependent methyltransferase